MVEELVRCKITSAVFVHSVPAISPIKSLNLTHKSIVCKAKELNMPYVWILEDDCRFSKPDAAQFFVANRPEQFDLYIGGISYGEPLPNNTIDKFSAMHCYMVHARFYDIFLKLPSDKHIDMALSDVPNRIYKVCNPFVAYQAPGYSDIAQAEVDYTDLFNQYEFL